MWELDCEERLAPKNWWFWTVVLEKTLESPLDCKEIQPVHPKEDQSWVFFGRTDAKAETPVLWLPHGKSWLIGQDSDAGREWGQEEKGMTEDEMAGWHHWLDGHEFEWTPGDGDGQGGLAWYNSCGHKESDTTEWLNWCFFGWQVSIRAPLAIVFISVSLALQYILPHSDANKIQDRALLVTSDKNFVDVLIWDNLWKSKFQISFKDIHR